MIKFLIRVPSNPLTFVICLACQIETLGVFGYNWGDKALIDKEDRRVALEQSEAMSPELLEVIVVIGTMAEHLEYYYRMPRKAGMYLPICFKTWIYSIHHWRARCRNRHYGPAACAK